MCLKIALPPIENNIRIWKIGGKKLVFGIKYFTVIENIMKGYYFEDCIYKLNITSIGINIQAPLTTQDIILDIPDLHSPYSVKIHDLGMHFVETQMSQNISDLYDILRSCTKRTYPELIVCAELKDIQLNGNHGDLIAETLFIPNPYIFNNYIDLSIKSQDLNTEEQKNKIKDLYKFNYEEFCKCV